MKSNSKNISTKYVRGYKKKLFLTFKLECRLRLVFIRSSSKEIKITLAATKNNAIGGRRTFCFLTKGHIHLRFANVSIFYVDYVSFIVRLSLEQ